MWPLRSDPMKKLLDEFLEANVAVDPEVPAHRAILEADPETRAAVLELAVKQVEKSKTWERRRLLQGLISRLLKSAVLTDARLLSLLDAGFIDLPPAGAVRAIEQHVAARGLSDELRRGLGRYRKKLDGDMFASAETRRLTVRVDAVLNPNPEAGAQVDGEWGAALTAWLEAASPDHRAAWNNLLRHAAQAAGKARPTASWSRRAAELVSAVGAPAFAARVEAWTDSAKLGYTHAPMWEANVELGISDRNQDVLKGLVWAAESVADPALAHVLARFGERCFRKIPNFGASSTRLGNACIHALSAMPGGIGVVHLSRLTEKVRYASGKRNLDRALDGAAERAGQSREDIEELAVPDAGLGANGVRRISIGAHTAELAFVDGARVELRWIRPDGKPQASVPKAVKEQFPVEVKALAKDRKQLEDLIAGQVARVQRLWMNDRRLPLGELRRRYLEHPVVGQIGRRLIWLCEHEGKRTALLWHEGALVPIGGDRVELSDAAEARLWHMIDCADLDELLVWRDALEARGIQQPFKQVWREVYRPREREGGAREGGAREAMFDDRFAGHIIRQHPFRNLCQQRGWQYGIQGHWDSANSPQLTLPRWDLGVTLDVTPLAHDRDHNFIFEYLVVGHLTFHRRVPGGVPISLGEVPPIVFSEIMRDVDMFVGVSTIANDPSFDESGFDRQARAYWAGAVFGDLAPLAETRREVLARVLPRTILRDRARLEDRWLVVDGATGPSRIHLGTGNVQRAKSTIPFVLDIDRDARARAASVFLPFEGDSILSDIIAKALVLAGE